MQLNNTMVFYYSMLCVRPWRQDLPTHHSYYQAGMHDLKVLFLAHVKERKLKQEIAWWLVSSHQKEEN